MPNTNIESSTGVVAALRALVPNRPLSFLESLTIAELQAVRLRELLFVDEPSFPTELIAELPRIQVIERNELPVSGASYWRPGRWVIAINASEPARRRRLTTLHEFKHILDHGHVHQLYSGNDRVSGDKQAEQAADFFAGCVLVPKRYLKQAFGSGIQKRHDLAALFDVSPPAVAVRLAQTGLTEARGRCDRNGHRPSAHSYYRQLHPEFEPLLGAAA